MKIAVLLLLLVTVCFVATSGRRRFLPTVADAADATDFLDGQERSGHKANGRFFFWPWNLRFTTQNYLTSTQVVTVFSTLTSISFTRCIPASLFSNALAQASSCRRRRRAVEYDVDVAELFDHPIVPSAVEQLEASAAPSTADQLGARSEPLIEASTDGDSSGRLNNGNLGVLIAAVTSTVTSYSITTTTYRTTAQLATTSALFCLPAGYGVC